MLDSLSSRGCCALLLATASAIVPLSCVAQAASAGSRPPGPSRVDLYGGYAYFHPINSDIYDREYLPINPGAVASLTGYFNNRFGLEAEGAFFPNGPNDCVYAAQAGPVFRYQVGRVVPFLHVLAGGARVGGPIVQPCTWGYGATAGLGFDYILPGTALRNRIAIRLIQADFAYSYVNFGTQSGPNALDGGVGQITAYRLTAGLVIRLGEMSSGPPASYGCEAQPVSVFPGDPITVTGKTLNLDANKRLSPIYSWSTTGGKVAGASENATITTTGLAPGDYTVTGRVNEGSQPNQHADCTASFRVVAFQPPTVSCSVNPNSIQPGDFSTISAVGRSPQNRPLNYSYGTTAGQATGSGIIGTLATANVAPGIVTVTCNVVDDFGNSASSTATVTVAAPVAQMVQQAPVVRSLCSLSFERDTTHPVRVDNEAKACLDSIALELNRDSNAVLVVVGKHDPQEKPEAAAERTLNVKQYLSEEKGIDPNRIEVRTGESTGRFVDNILVPVGATWDPSGTSGFDPVRVTRHGDPFAPNPR